MKNDFPEFPTDPSELVKFSISTFKIVSRRYNLMKAILSGGQEMKWKSTMFRSFVPKVPRKCLDIATGTGDIVKILQKYGEPELIVGIDLSEDMVRLAQPKFVKGKIKWLLGDLNKLPFTDESFELITVGYGLRYCHDIPWFLESCYRILRPDGVFFSFDLGHPNKNLLRPIWLTYLFLTGTFLGTLLHGKIKAYWHLFQSLRVFPGQKRVYEMLIDTGFSNVRYFDVLHGTMTAYFAKKAVN